ICIGRVPTADPPPPTEKHPVTDTYHGVKVVDDYRWLEDAHNSEVKRWVEAQNTYSRAYFAHLSDLAAIRDTLRAYDRITSVQYSQFQYARGKFFAMRSDPRLQQPALVCFTSVDDLKSEHPIVDPNSFEKSGHLAIDWFRPSPDAKLLAVAMSHNGSEDDSLYIFDTDSGKQIGEIIPRVSYATAGGSAAWLPDNKTILYTRYPQGTERPKEDVNFYQQLYSHRIGTPPADDTYVLGKEFPRIAEISLSSDASGKYIIASVANGDGGEFEHFLRDSTGEWKRISRFEDAVIAISADPDGDLFLLSRKDAPRGKILKMTVRDLDLAKAKLIVPESDGSIESPPQGGGNETILATATKLYVQTVNGGPNEIRIFDHSGKPLGRVSLPQVSATSNVLGIGGDDVLLRVRRHTTPAAYYRYDPVAGLSPTPIRVTPPVDLTGFEVERVFCTSKDGTKVPMTIIHQKQLKLDGAHPALITGYGGYGLSMTPNYGSPLWLEQGGVLAITNLRGGAEYGEAWHRNGMLLHKQNVFDDFAACAQYLVSHHYTSREHLAAIGGSNGGLLMGAELTQHPNLFRAVVSFVGIYDMLRSELDPNGQFNTTEYGSVKDPQQFQALYAYSPYHHVVDGADYPAVLFMTGDNDARVNPAHSRKMTARLQAATCSSYPVLLRTSATSGHGFGTAHDEQIEEEADMYGFLFDQLHMSFHGSP
ncbi:MAG: S9 family peptidase, partial [Acidobacteriaceae bacterium]|nr:S9 family peptidase [Acidobacteriaceae bacterium]